MTTTASTQIASLHAAALQAAPAASNAAAAHAAPLTRARLGLRPSATVFACGAPLFKYLPMRDRVFTDLASRLGDLTFLFTGDPAAESTRLFVERQRAAFAAAGFDPDRLLAWHDPRHDASPHAWLQVTDIHLDSIGWSDLPATRAALACHLPAITMPTGLQRGCASARLLREQGLAHGIAATLDDYIDIATALSDPRRRAAYWQAATLATAASHEAAAAATSSRATVIA